MATAPLKAKDHHVVIGVDESHADSLEAIQGGLTFVSTSNPNSKATLFSVLNNNNNNSRGPSTPRGSLATPSEDLKKRLERLYKNIIEHYARANPTARPIEFHTIGNTGNDTIATSIIKEATKERATLIAIGAGARQLSGSVGVLGSVANEIVLRSHNAHVLICKRMGVAGATTFQQKKPRCFLFAVDGSVASRVGLSELVVNVCKAGDFVRCVTVSNNTNDAVTVVGAEVAAIASVIEERGVRVSSEHFLLRNNTAAEVLCQMAAEGAIVGTDDATDAAETDINNNNNNKSVPPVNALVLGSSNGSSGELGSCTKWCVAKCPISVLVMKISVCM